MNPVFREPDGPAGVTIQNRQPALPQSNPKRAGLPKIRIDTDERCGLMGMVREEYP
jgi:hypothetical protein